MAKITDRAMCNDIAYLTDQDWITPDLDLDQLFLKRWIDDASNHVCVFPLFISVKY